MIKRTLKVASYHIGRVQPYNTEIMIESKAKLDELARLDKERMMLEEVRNKYESYMYYIKNKLMDDEEAIGAVSTEAQRDELKKSAEDAEEWMYDEGYDASLEVYQEKYDELSAPAEKVFFRAAEVPARAEAIKALSSKLDKVEALMKKWETSMPQVTEEERAGVLEKVEVVRKWISEKVEAQAAADPTSDPVFISADVPLQTTELQSAVSKLNRKPKPAPKKEEKKAAKEEKNETATDGEEKKEETPDKADGEEKKEEEASEEPTEKKSEEEDEDEL
jgi:uncharacterized protein YoxC